MKSKKALVLTAFITLLLSSCFDSTTKNDLTQAVPEFKASMTRASGANWDKGDKIGISKLSDGKIQGDNYEYTLAEDNKFVPAKASLEYSRDESACDFTAYYPYSELTREGSYKVDLADQSDLTKIDLLYSDNAKNKKIGDKDVTLKFTHKLSLFNLIVNNESGKDYEIKLTTQTNGTFSLLQDRFILDGTIEAVKGFDNKSALLMPGAETAVEVSCNGKTATRKVRKELLKSGKRCKLTINIREGEDTTISFGSATIEKWTGGKNYDLTLEVGEETVDSDFYASPAVVEEISSEPQL